MKTTNVLIPTDFSLTSLNAINGLLLQKPGQQFNISLVHFFQLSDSISELLMLNRRSREYQYISREFEDQLRAFKQKYPDQIKNINAEFFYGSTISVFKNYLEAKETELLVILQDHEYKKLNQNSSAPILLLQRSGCELLKVGQVARPEPQHIIAKPQVFKEKQHQLL